MTDTIFKGNVRYGQNLLVIWLTNWIMQQMKPAWLEFSNIRTGTIVRFMTAQKEVKHVGRGAETDEANTINWAETNAANEKVATDR